MRKNIFWVLSALLVLVSCDNNKFTIKGKLPEKYNGQAVYLFPDQRFREAVDSAIVTDGQFIFSGVAPDTVQLQFIAFDKRVRPYPVVMEKGDIKVEPDSLNRRLLISGTPKNEDLTDIENSLELYQKNLWRIQEQYKHLDKLTNLDKEKWQKEEKVIFGNMQQTLYQFIKENVHNQLGEYTFTAYGGIFDAPQWLELFPLFRDAFRELPFIRERKQYTYNKMNTADGKPYADIKGTSPEGKEIRLSDYEGKVILLDFWASWCGPCRASMPKIREINNTYKSRGLVVLAISLDEDKDAWMQASKEDKIDWLNILSSTEENAGKIYGVEGIPETILIDKKGIIVGRNFSGVKLTDKIEELLK